jgi:hypothetical protein
MAKEIDVYAKWLDVKETNRPLTHYQLLRLKQFEDDPAKVRDHYRKMNAHVRRFQTGDYAKQSQDLLNELARAMLCLTDSKRKAEYDVTLGRKTTQPGRQRSLEEILLARGIVDAPKLEKARKFSTAVGVDLQDAIVQSQLAPADGVMSAFAESIGLPFVELGEMILDGDLLKKMPATLARKHSCVPVMMDDGQVMVAAPHVLDPEVEEELRIRMGNIVRLVLCTPQGVNGVINQHFTKEQAAAEQAAGGAAKVGAKPAAAAKAKGGAKSALAAKAADAKSDPEPEAKVVSAADKEFAAKVALGAGFVVYVIVWALKQFDILTFQRMPLGPATMMNVVGIVGAAAVAGITYTIVKSK